MALETMSSLSPGARASAEQTTPEPLPGEPVAVEPDRGPPLPELPAQPRVRAMVRDPETTFVYWDGRDGARSTYVHGPVSGLERVTVSPAEDDPRGAPVRSAELPWAGTPRPAPSAAEPAPAVAAEQGPAAAPDRWRAVGEPRGDLDPAAPAPRAGGPLPWHVAASSPPVTGR